MRHGFRLLVLALCLATVLSAEDPLAEWSGPIDHAAILREQQDGAGSIGVVASLIDGGAAAAAGLQVGDLIVGYDGYRCRDASELMLLRLRPGSITKPVRLQLLGADRIVELRVPSASLGAMRTAGFSSEFGIMTRLESFAARGLSVDQELDPIGHACWRQFPSRYAIELIRSVPAGAAPAWLKAFDRRYRALCRQEWAEAAAIRVEGVPAGLAALDRFHAALAERHRHGEQDPDPGRHGLSPFAWTLCYPYPLPAAPAAGEGLSPAFVDVVKAISGRPADEDHLQTYYQFLGEELTALQGEDLDYLLRLRLAVLSPHNHGGWPARHSAVLDQKSRPTVRAAVARFRAENPDDAWGELAGIFLDHHEHCDAWSQRVPEMPVFRAPMRALGTSLAALAKRSPWLGERAAHSVDAFIAGYGFYPYVHTDLLLEWTLRSASLAVTAKPSRLYAHLGRMGDGGLLGRLPKSHSYLASDPARMHALMNARTPRSDLETWPSLPRPLPNDERLRILGELANHMAAGIKTAALDYTLWFGINNPSGLSLDLFDEVLERWMALDAHDTLRLSEFTGSALGLPGKEALAEEQRLRTLIAGIPWQDPARARAAILGALRTHGTQFGSQRLADRCAAHGLDDLEALLRERAIAPYAALRRAYALRKPTNEERLAVDVQQLAVATMSARTATRAAQQWKTLRAQAAKNRKSTLPMIAYLLGARCNLMLGDLALAETAWRESFAKPDGELEFHGLADAEGVSADPADFRGRIIAAFRAHPDWSEALRQRLAGAAPPARMGATAAALLRAP